MEPLHGDEKFTRFMTDENDETVDELTSGSVGFRHLLIGLQRENGQSWWEIQESCEAYDQNYQYYLKDLIHNSCKEPTIYVFNDKVFSSTVSYITGSGILGMYLIYFMIILSVLRDMTIKADEIWIEDIDHPENLMRKCLEVYLARDMENFELEQELFEELIFIMRSREICIKLSREEET
ncbi:piezo-type mechanosensitive ion channel component-like [Sitophilus oryzae]|uniref:Piezo-type mechanosensitive ion channel component-like n=1 Tax=Sitophilus oryzae TaxID=7048 RepID=A0A6J2Y6G4_SITOR|nr:piezo-type mechanosensitive ion channel component-like [Sitophilus oryzae]